MKVIKESIKFSGVSMATVLIRLGTFFVLFHPWPLARFRETHFPHEASGTWWWAVLSCCAQLLPSFRYFHFFQFFCRKVLKYVTSESWRHFHSNFQSKTLFCFILKQIICQRENIMLLIDDCIGLSLQISGFLVKWELKYLSKHNKQEVRAGDEVQRPSTLRTSITF